MANHRLQQLFAAREAVPGTVIAAGTLVAVGNAKNRIKDPRMVPTVEQYRREILYGSLSSLEDLLGKVEMDISFAVELAGSTHATNAPVWAPFLEACGMRQCVIGTAVWSGTVGGTATLLAKVARHGALWQTAGAAKVIRIIHDTYNTQTNVFFEAVTGTPANADVYWPVTSDVTVGPTITFASGTTAAVGYGWYPNSRNIITATCASSAGTHAVNDIYKGNTSGTIYQAVSTTAAVADGTLVQFYVLDGTPAAETITSLTDAGDTTILSALAQLEIPSLSLALGQDGRIITSKGCRGTFKLSGERGKPAFLEFTFKGVYSSVANGGSVPGVTFESKTPPRMQGIDFKLFSYITGEPGCVSGIMTHTNGHVPRIVSFNFDMNSPANLQEDMTQSTGTGPVAHITSARQTQGGMKIDLRPEGSYPIIKKFTGSEPFAIKARLVDSTNAANNAFLLSAPGVKITGNGPTETNNFKQEDITFSFSSRDPDGSDGDQRELVLTYHYSSTATW